jgi:hypothetical protein
MSVGMLRHSHLEVQIVEGRSPGLANMTHSSPRPPTCLELFGGFRELKEDDNKLVIWKSRFLRVVVLDFRNITHAPPRPIWKSRCSMVSLDFQNITHAPPRPPVCFELFGEFHELKEDDGKVVIWKSRFPRVVFLDLRSITNAQPRPPICFGIGRFSFRPQG